MANRNTWLTTGPQSGDAVQLHDLLQISGRSRLPPLCFSSCHLLQQQMQFLRARGQTTQLLLVPCQTEQVSVLESPTEQTSQSAAGSAGAPQSLTSPYTTASTGADSQSHWKQHAQQPSVSGRCNLEEITLALTPRTQQCASLPDTLTSLSSPATIIPQASEVQQTEEHHVPAHQIPAHGKGIQTRGCSPCTSAPLCALCKDAVV